MDAAEIIDINNIPPPTISLKEAMKSMQTLVDFFSSRRYNQHEMESVVNLRDVLSCITLDSTQQSKLPFKKLNFD